MSTDNPTTESNNHRALDSLKRIVQARVEGRMDDAEWDEFMGVVGQILARVDRERDARPA
ncbi:hypothetical protein [Ectothiorhodospira shaposhnikovii]|uniref:hypothetical protein n=1 Tax=Ectothiorhodospira shaposhnikovii TaxID=1054 RepID=UPI0039A20EEF